MSSSSVTPAQDPDVTFHGFAVKHKGLLGTGLTFPKFEAFDWHPRKLGANDVEIRITHSSICASDKHIATDGWKGTEYPVVPGHEIVGVVTQTGPAVKDVRVGQRYGVGPQVLSCMSKDCIGCGQGQENWCDKSMVQAYNSHYPDGEKTYGGYATHIRVHERWAFPIPENIPSEAAAPLLCAGVTTFAPLQRFKCGPGQKVGIVGLGGLGHLAIQFAAKMGAHVVVIGHSGAKADDAKRLGAAEHWDASNADVMKNNAKTLDLVVCTANAKGMKWEEYLGLMKPNSTFVLVALPEEPLSFMPSALVMNAVRFSGSIIGSVEETRQMLEFAAKNDVRAWTECMPMKQINEAYEKFNKGEPRYRIVLTN